MLRNFWYGVEHSQAVTQKPQVISLMGNEIVLYRNQQNSIVALDNRCAHRGTALNNGWVEENCIHCPYHGWSYQEDGSCTHIPANQPGAAIPKKARIASYPVHEEYGLVWLFWGDRPEAECPPLPDLPEFSDPTWRTIRGNFTWDGHYTRTIANTVDMSHASFVHASAFGRKEAPRIQTYYVEKKAWGGSAKISFKTKPAYSLKLILGNQPPDGSITSSFHMPNVTQVYHQFGNIKFILFLTHVPVSDRLTLTHWLHLRNFATTPLADYFMSRDVVKTLKQDNQVVSTQPPGPVPEDLIAEQHASSDALEIAYRQLRQHYLQINLNSVSPSIINDEIQAIA
jgi:phenylpropionate dioxygenase-like ring-hydroxylating dioxygenase large terminal subunit